MTSSNRTFYTRGVCDAFAGRLQQVLSALRESVAPAALACGTDELDRCCHEVADAVELVADLALGTVIAERLGAPGCIETQLMENLYRRLIRIETYIKEMLP